MESNSERPKRRDVADEAMEYLHGTVNYLKPPSEEEMERAWYAGTYVDEQTREVVLPPYGYRVDLDRCTTYRDILDWTLHLAGKDWVDGDLLRGTARRIFEANGIEWPHSA